ncbi:hypothetical protein HPB47_009357 [Ixodes persulcatus]|uniref:Uncharacterized protein n=1 Tax=Ixodes persulcatus TaxID=34615 RepID=A0AC60P265_IXOPE|nr:hypothetical protein HPB47_009357 [Ixodes persulcatus]
MGDKTKPEDRERCVADGVDVLQRLEGKTTRKFKTNTIVDYFLEHNLKLLTSDKEGGFVALYKTKAKEAIQKNFKPTLPSLCFAASTASAFHAEASAFRWNVGQNPILNGCAVCCACVSCIPVTDEKRRSCVDFSAALRHLPSDEEARPGSPVHGRRRKLGIEARACLGGTPAAPRRRRRRKDCRVRKAALNGRDVTTLLLCFTL